MPPTEKSPAPARGFPLEPNAPAASFYLQPAGLLSGGLAAEACASGAARWLAGGSLAFTSCAVIRRRGDGREEALLDLAGLRAWAAEQGPGIAAAVEDRLDRMAAPRPAIAGLRFGRPLIMGIVNVTPDSFSDGGDFIDADRAIAHGVGLVEAGADILDIGGESTRPGAAPVGVEEEIRRVLPVVRALASQGAVVSIDTRHAAVMAAATEAGARIINDITALSGDSDSLSVAARSGAWVVLMHMQGEPQTMQREPRYRDAPLDLYDFFVERIAACKAVGVPLDRILLDPGIGFGKTVEHNFQILERLAVYHDLGCPLLLGASRKNFIARISRGEEVKRRFPGSMAAGFVGLSQGAQILRVHDVAETFQARAVWTALTTCGQTTGDQAGAP